MIISCPYCQTRYQVAAEAIGSAGRKVQCANCQRAWQAGGVPDPDRMLVPPDEEALDAAFGSVEDAETRGKVVAMAGNAPAAASTPMPSADPDLVAAAAAAVLGGPGATQSAAQRFAAYAKRQQVLAAKSPAARFRRVMRIAAAVVFVGVVGGMVLAREQIVRQAPEMAGVYEAVGLGVNVVGLELTGLHSVAALREGKDVLEVTAEIGNVAGHAVPVPPIIVTVRDASDQPLYQWSVAPPIAALDRGETVPFEARLTQPPPDAVSVKLSFATGRPPAVSPASPPPASSPTAAAPKDAH